jgi:TonB family protein
MMTTLLDLLAQMGRAVWKPVWVPILAWTAFTLPFWGLLTRLDRLHPYAEYRLLQVLLAALPVGIGATIFLDGWLATSPNLSETGLGGVVLPAIETTVQPSSVPTFGWTHLLGLGTFAAILVGVVELGRLSLNGIAVARIRAGAQGRSLSDPARTVVNSLSQALDIDRPVRVCIHPEVVVPATIGGPRPLVLLPPSLSDRPVALRMALIHELVHIRRYDDVAHLIERFVAAHFAVHPLVHTLTTRIAEARERACDAAVLADDDTSASAYARLLTAFADGTSPRRLGALSLSESPSSLTIRLRAMRSSVSHWVSSPFSLIASLLTIGLVTTLGIVACSDSVAPSVQKESSHPESTGTSETNDEVYVEVEERPECGGISALQEKVEYPDAARKAEIEGRVVVQYVLNEEGTVTKPKITKGVHETLNEAALAAVKKLDCEQGRVRGEAVKTRMALPVTFKLPRDSSSSSASATN